MYIQEKKRLLESYMDQTLQLEKLIHASEYERLDELLGKRASLIRDVDALDSQNANEVEKARQEFLPLLTEMIQTEARVKQLMQESLSQLKAEMNRINTAKKANQAYQAKGYSYDGAFFDKKIEVD